MFCRFDPEGCCRIRRPEGKKQFRMAISGDISPWRNGEKLSSENRASVITEKIRFFLDKGDFNLIQWETPLAETETPIAKSGPALNALPVCARIPKACNFHGAMLANNHTGDQGTDNQRNTKLLLEQAGTRTVGFGENEEDASRPLLLEKDGLKIAVFNFAEHEFGIASRTRPGCAPLRSVRCLERVREQKRVSDLVIVTMHGGHEQNPHPSPRMVELFRAFADAGASAVFNCHTHCPEGTEIWHGVPIVYSPGNFYFPKYADKKGLWNYGYLPLFSFDEKGACALEILPYRMTPEQVIPLEGPQREAFFRYLEEISDVLEDPDKLERFFDAWSVKLGKAYTKLSLDPVKPGWETHPDEPAYRDSLLNLRNSFTCEAHQDIIRSFLYQLEQGRAGKDPEGEAEVERRQNPEFSV